MQNFYYHELNPVAFQIGKFPIYWYGIAYIIGFIFVYLLFPSVAKRLAWAQNKSKSELKKMIDDFLLYALLGVLVGGRLGYVLFYNPSLLSSFFDAINPRNGGMSFHGGFLGVVIAALVFCKVKKLPFFGFCDAIAVLTPFALMIGRLANFINGELWGRATTVPWAMIFSNDELKIPRHPSQLYEAFLEGVILLAVMVIASRLKFFNEYMGRLCSLFIFGYALARFSIEFVREPNEGLGNVFLFLTMGQFLTVFMFIFAIILFITSFITKKN